MPTPAATVRLQIHKIKNVPTFTPVGNGDTRYAWCEIQFGDRRVRTGRSRPLPLQAGDFDLTAEAVPWNFELRVEPGAQINVTIEVCEDRGNAAPPTPSLITFSIVAPWTTVALASAAGGGMAAEYSITTTLLTATDAAVLARAAKPTGISGTLAVPQCFLVEITGVTGLYKPRTPTTGSSGATRVAEYISEDNLGRIYTNRLPDGSWKRDTQYIDVLLRVTGIGGAKIPAGARIKWIIEDPDDPTNDAPDFHRDWGQYVDPNDYTSGTSVGAHRDDNTLAHSPGNSNAGSLFGAAASPSPTARWAALMGGPTPAPASATQAESAISVTTSNVGTSSVRIHCPNVLGTNLLVRAELLGAPAGIPVHNAATGVMTMWSRIDVEVVRMEGAVSVAGVLPLIPSHFHPACVQLDFKMERIVKGVLDTERMTESTEEAEEGRASSKWVDNAAVFTKRGTPGWFFLGAARLPSPTPASPAALWVGTGYTISTVGNDVILDVPAGVSNADSVDFEWGVAPNNFKAEFIVQRTQPSVLGTQIVLRGNDVAPNFTGYDSDGSLTHAYKSRMFVFPQHETAPGSSTLAPGGLAIPATAKVSVFPRGRWVTGGVSPPVLVGGQYYFAGRTVLFTHAPAFLSSSSPVTPKPNFDQKVINIVVHEFLHAFGMPHKCGHKDWRTPVTTSCCMNYPNTSLLDAGHHPIPGSAGKNGNHMCGRHLMEVRRVHLERNKGLNW